MSLTSWRFVSSAPDCGTNPGWRKNDNMCYYYNDTDNVDFITAMSRCYHEKALLVSILSQSEQEYVNSMVRPFIPFTRHHAPKRSAPGLTIVLLFQVGTGEVSVAWIGMWKAGIANGEYRCVEMFV